MRRFLWHHLERTVRTRWISNFCTGPTRNLCPSQSSCTCVLPAPTLGSVSPLEQAASAANRKKYPPSHTHTQTCIPQEGSSCRGTDEHPPAALRTSLPPHKQTRPATPVSAGPLSSPEHYTLSSEVLPFPAEPSSAARALPGTGIFFLPCAGRSFYEGLHRGLLSPCAL